MPAVPESSSTCTDWILVAGRFPGVCHMAEATAVVYAGVARSCPRSVPLDHDAVEAAMDPRDRGIGVESSLLKEKETKEELASPKEEIDGLRIEVKQGASGSVQQEAKLRDLTAARDDLMRERDATAHQVLQVRNDLTELGERLKVVEGEKQLLYASVGELRREIETRKTEVEREKRRKEKAKRRSAEKKAKAAVARSKKVRDPGISSAGAASASTPPGVPTRTSPPDATASILARAWALRSTCWPA